MRDDLVVFSITNISRSQWTINSIECKSTILTTDLLNDEDNVTLNPSITNQFIWKLDEGMKTRVWKYCHFHKLSSNYFLIGFF